MRKLVVTEFMSLDGVIEAPGGEDDFPHGAWTMPVLGRRDRLRSRARSWRPPRSRSSAG